MLTLQDSGGTYRQDGRHRLGRSASQRNLHATRIHVRRDTICLTDIKRTSGKSKRAFTIQKRLLLSFPQCLEVGLGRSSGWLKTASHIARILRASSADPHLPLPVRPPSTAACVRLIISLSSAAVGGGGVSGEIVMKVAASCDASWSTDTSGPRAES